VIFTSGPLDWSVNRVVIQGQMPASWEECWELLLE